MIIDGPQLLSRLAEIPGGQELLDVAGKPEFAALEPELVGGAVRDLVLGRAPRELDVVVNSGAEPFLDALSAAVDGVQRTFHERFSTGSLSWGQGTIDVATRRAESYPSPGALPEVREGTQEEDLRRRDFTVNAITLSLSSPRLGSLRAVDHAFEDLDQGLLRVLHERSFLEDPTRLVRLGRYMGRLGFTVEQHTAELAQEALAAGSLWTVSGARLGAELRLALNEEDAVAALCALMALGVLKALDPRLSFREMVAREALSLLRDSIELGEARQEPLLLATILAPMLIVVDDEIEQTARELLDWLEFPAADRQLAIDAAIAVEYYEDELCQVQSPSDLYYLAANASLESVALGGAWGGEHAWDATLMAGQWLDELRHLRLQITGKDLIAAGIPEGPHIRHALEEVMAERLDGALPDEPHPQLEAALKAARREFPLHR